MNDACARLRAAIQSRARVFAGLDLFQLRRDGDAGVVMYFAMFFGEVLADGSGCGAERVRGVFRDVVFSVCPRALDGV